MKKRKITYSLTAQQKKKLKQGKEENIKEEPEGEVAVKKKPHTAVFICIVAAVLAAVSIFLAIYLPLKLSAEVVTKDTFIKWANFNPNDPDNPYTPGNPNPNPPQNPIATITLEGDDEKAFKSVFGASEISLSYEIFMDDAPYAGTNFMYLAESGFFDGTIISDINRGFAKMSGFTDTKNASNKALDDVLVRALKGFSSHKISKSGTSNFKLGYRLTPETTRANKGNSLGYLLMMAGSSSYYSTSTTFMLTVWNNPQFNFADDNTSIESYTTWLGKIITDDNSTEILQKIGNSSIVKTKSSGNSHYPEVTIRIKSIKTDLSNKKKQFLLNNFEEIIEGGLAVSTWRPNAYTSDYYKFDE